MNKLLKQAFISQMEYQKVKKMVGFSPNNYIWKHEKGLHKNLTVK